MSSEEVLMIVQKVKHKKCEGSLYLMGQRMAWMPSGKDTFTVSHNYVDIKVQKISPDTKDKVQLQIVLHDSGANTFHFNNPEGRAAQVKDREGIKEALQQLLPSFRRKVNSELEEKNRLLQEVPELFQLYKDLVVSGVVTAEEFWQNRAKLSESKGQQEVGVSAAFLADIKPQTDGCNGLKYNLTTDTIESIFKTYPAVQQKHAEYVPDKLSEAEFWTKFFQSHYFHRDRVNLGPKDLFAECAKSDDQDMKKELVKPVSDVLVDLTGITDDNTGEGYGTENPDTKAAVVNPANASLLRRFNQHSSMVLRVCDKAAAGAALLANAVNGAASGGGAALNSLQVNGTAAAAGTKGAELDPPPAKKAKIREKVEYADLSTPSSSSQHPALRITHLDRYLHGPTPVTATQYNTSEDTLHASQALTQEMMVWNPRLPQVLPSQTAISVLWELSPGGALMQGHTQQELHQLVPTEVQQDIKNHYSALCELLRHFWACFPVSSKQLEEKLLRMHSNLERFQMTKVRPLREKLRSYHYSMNLVGHMDDLLEAAFNKFNAWQMKRQNKRT